MTARQWLNLIQELQSIYDDATSTISGRIGAYTARFLAEDIARRKLLKSGLLDKNKYGLWIKNNVFKGFRWKSIVFNVISTLIRANRRANKAIEREQDREFRERSNRQLYDLETKTGVDTGVKPRTDDEVSKLLKQYPELLPRRKEDIGKERGWEQERIYTSINQSIIRGESVPDAARRLANTLGQSNMRVMTRYARTALTCAQNAGTIDSMKRVAAMGIHVKKKWLATLDERTRNSHRELDGQVRELNEDFRSPLGRISYPGDITANPADVWNCRCTLTYVYPDFSDLAKNPQRRENVGQKPIIPGMTYRQWERYKQTGETPQSETSNLERRLRTLE